MTLILQRDFTAQLVQDNLDWKFAVAGYIDGTYAWNKQQWGEFDGHKERISVTADPMARVFDLERGNASQAQVNGAIQKRWETGQASVLYCSLGRYQAIRRDYRGWPVSFWVAHWLVGGIPSLADLHELPYPDWCGWQLASYPTYDLSYIDPQRWPDWL